MDNLPAISNQVPSVENVLQEMMQAGQTDGLLEEILLQLRTFTTIVWCACYGNEISVGLTRYSEPVEMNGRIWQQRTLPPEMEVRMSIRQIEYGRSLVDMLMKAINQEPYSAILSLETDIDMTADGAGTIKFDLTIPIGNPYGERWRSLILIMFNGTLEMKAKVDYIAGMRIERKTELEDALFQTCEALSAFYEWSMRTNSRFWNRDPFGAQGPQGAHGPQGAIRYEPRLGKF